MITNNTLFENNKATEEGGAILAQSFNYIKLLDNTKFNQNSAYKGDALLALNSIYNVTIHNSSFMKTTSTNFLSLSFIDKVVITNSTFQVSSTALVSEYPGLTLNSLKTTLISQCLFQNFYSSKGGAIYIEETTLSKSKDNSFVIEKSRFEGNRATDSGGAIFINDVLGVII